MSETNDRVIFLYLRDPNDSAHVATLARFKQGNMLTFAWAVNKVTKHVVESRNGREQSLFTSRIVHDTFNKARGRQIAEGRLTSDKSSLTIELYENERPLKAMLETLASGCRIGELQIPNFLSRWAAAALQSVYMDDALKIITADSSDSANESTV